MHRPIRFGIQGGPLDDPVALAEHARRIEALGYDEFFTMDHFGGQSVDPFMPLMTVAAATTRLRVGPLVINNEFHHPALLARTAISVDQLSAGRLTLGLGTGYARAEHDAIGLELRDPGPRVDRFGESLFVLRELLDEGACQMAGTHHVVDVDGLLPPVQEHVPFLIGGHGRRVVELAGRFADIFQFTGLEHTEDGTLQPAGFRVDHLDLRAQWLEDAAGSRNAEIERSALVQMCVVGDGAPTDAEVADRYRFDPIDVADCPFVLTGSIEQIVDKLGRLRERLGITHWVIREPEAFAPVLDALG